MVSMVNDRIKALRIEQGIFQNVVAEMLKCSAATVSYYENGRDLPSDVIIAYCRYFNVSADWLLGLTTDRRPGGSDLSKQLDAVAALTAGAGGSPFTSDQLSALLDALLAYYHKGARAGNTPVESLSAFVVSLRKAVVACSGESTAPVVVAVNAVAVAVLGSQDILLEWLERAEREAEEAGEDEFMP